MSGKLAINELWFMKSGRPMASGVIPLDWHADVVQAAEEETNNVS